MRIGERKILLAFVLSTIFIISSPAEATSYWTMDQLDDIYIKHGKYIVPVLEFGEYMGVFFPSENSNQHHECEALLFSGSFSTLDGSLSLEMPMIDFKGSVKVIVTENNGYAFIDLLYPGESVSSKDVGKKVLKVTPNSDYQGIYFLDTNPEQFPKTLLILPLVLHSESTGYALPLMKNPFVENDGYIVPILKVPSHYKRSFFDIKKAWEMEFDAWVFLDYDVVKP